MNVKKQLAALLSLTLAFSSQLSITANAEETIVVPAVQTTEEAAETPSAPETGALLPRVPLEYKGIEVVDASEEVLTLADGKKIYIASGEKRTYNGMYKKGNKLDISGTFAYNEAQDLYLNVLGSIELSMPEYTPDSPELAEKIASLPQIKMDGGFLDVLKATDDILYLSNGMKVYVSSGKQHYTGVFAVGNMYCFEGVFAYDAEEDIYYNVDSEMYLAYYCGNFSVAGWYEEDENGNLIEVTETTTTTYVENITTATTTTTAYQPTERRISEAEQPEGKYPVKFFDYVYYWISKEITVDHIDFGSIVDDSGTVWSFSGEDLDPYELGHGDVIKVDGYFFYIPERDTFGAIDNKYELVSESNDYEKYATIEIKEDFPHVIIDKRLAADHMIQYEVDLKDVEVTKVELDDDIFTVTGGYVFAFDPRYSDYSNLKVGDHISISGRFEYHDYGEGMRWYASTNYHIDGSKAGRFTYLEKDSEPAAPKAERKEAPGKKGDANVDDGVDLADVVFIMQAMANPDKYELTPKGRENADVANTGNGVTLEDACAIQTGLLYGEF